MTRKYRVLHETSYKYAADVMHSHHLLHLVPRPAPYQQCLEHEIQIEPASHRRVDQVDAFGNPLVRLELAQPHRELTVISRMQIEVHARPAVSPETTDAWEKVRDAFAFRGAWPARDQLDAARFRHESPHVRVKQAFTDYSAACFPEGRPILACAEALSTKIHADIKYEPGRDHHRHVAYRSARNAPWRVPGLRALHDFLPAITRLAGALRQWLPAYQRHAE